MRKCKVLPVLITAPASRSGKDYTANYIYTYLKNVPLFGDAYVVSGQYKFATELKKISHTLFKYRGALPPSTYETHPMFRKTKLKGLDLNMVDVWIRLGEFLRDIDSTIWSSQVVEQIHSKVRDKSEYVQATWENGLLASKKFVYVPVISDWRMAGEYEHLRKEFGNAVTLEVQASDGVALKMDGQVPPEYVQSTLINCKTPDYQDVVREWITTKLQSAVQALAHGE